MMSSPPSATTGSSLYMHFPAVQSSSYIFGAQESTVLNGLSTYNVWVSRDSSLAASHAFSGEPANSPTKSLFGATTMQKQSFGTFTKAPARSTTLRTGVHLFPMIIGLVTTAPSQWKKFKICGPPTPGNKYLLPPEKPTTSCGKTGPTIITWS